MRRHGGLDQGKKNYKKTIESLYDDVSKGANTQNFWRISILENWTRPK